MSHLGLPPCLILDSVLVAETFQGLLRLFIALLEKDGEVLRAELGLPLSCGQGVRDA